MFPSFVLLIIRLALTVFCIVCLVCSGVQDSNGTTKWFIYLTNWSYTLLTLTFILLSSLSAYALYHGWRNRFQEPGYQGGNYGSFDVPEDVKIKNASEVSVAIRRHERKREVFRPKPSRWYHQVTWFLYNVAFSAGILVTIYYWAFESHGTPEFLDISFHALNSVFILTELFFGRVAIRLLHAVYAMIYCIVYVIFTVIYWKAGGLNTDNKPYIYDKLNYEQDSAGSVVAIILPTLLFAPPLLQLFLFGLYKLRCRCFDPFI